MSSDLIFLFTLRYYHGAKFIQSFDAYHHTTTGRTVWDQAWPLFELQQAYKRLATAIRAEHAENDR